MAGNKNSGRKSLDEPTESIRITMTIKKMALLTGLSVPTVYHSIMELECFKLIKECDNHVYKVFVNRKELG